MKFCYVDESGTGDEDFAVMVGIIVDAQRMRPTKTDWRDLLRSLEEMVGRPIREIHTRHFYAANGPWRGFDAAKRREIITAVFDWIAARKHKIAYTAVDKARFREGAQTDHRLQHVETVWRLLGLHLVLGIQKAFQAESNNKGNTVLVFDNEHKEQAKFTDLLLAPPAWTETYYSRGRKQDALDQIVDVPYFADSEHVHLLQVADFVAYFLRRFCELEAGGNEKFDGERQHIRGWAEKALKQSIPVAAIFPKKARCACAELFHTLAPPCIRQG